MPDYKYRAALRDGKIIIGKMFAVNKSQAISKLKLSKIQPIKVKRMREVKRTKSKPAAYSVSKSKELYKNIMVKPKFDLKNMTLNDLKKIQFNPFRRVSSKDIVSFVNNLYILKKAKFNNVQALESVYEGIENPTFKDIVEDILIGVQSGERLNEVMSNYPDVFPPMFINFIKVGEESGSLDDALLHARDYIESSRVLRKQVISAVVPKVLQFLFINILMIVAVIIGVPILKDVYAEFDSTDQLPHATLVAVDVVNWLIANWYFIVGIILLFVLAFFIYKNTPIGRYNWDRFVLTAPGFGNLVRNITVSKFFEAMLLNLKNGMRIQESLEVSKNVTNNYYFLSIVEVGKSNSLTGSSWIEPFEEQHLFTPMTIEMLKIGMKTDLTEMMGKLNEYINMEIKESLDKFVKWLPDITYTFVGIALIIFMFVVMVPLINVYMGSFISIPT